MATAPTTTRPSPTRAGGGGCDRWSQRYRQRGRDGLGASQPARPNAVAGANPTSGLAPLTVQFTGTGSSDPNGDTLAYAWDLDGDGAYDDSTIANPSRVYSTAGPVAVGLRVSDPGGLSDTDSVTITVGAPPVNELPVPIIDTPSSSFTWAVDDPIEFSGGATDAEDGQVAEAGLSWALIIHHCTPGGGCHEHPPVAQVSGVDHETFDAPTTSTRATSSSGSRPRTRTAVRHRRASCSSPRPST